MRKDGAREVVSAKTGAGSSAPPAEVGGAQGADIHPDDTHAGYPGGLLEPARLHILAPGRVHQAGSTAGEEAQPATLQAPNAQNDTWICLKTSQVPKHDRWMSYAHSPDMLIYQPNIFYISLCTLCPNT